MTDQKPLTAEERAEARRIADAATPGPWSHCCGTDVRAFYERPSEHSHRMAAASTSENAAFIAASRTLVPRLLDALEAAERERNVAESFHKAAVADRNLAWHERDTARAQVATLAEALREIAKENYSYSADAGIARAALKAAGVEP